MNRRFRVTYRYPTAEIEAQLDQPLPRGRRSLSSAPFHRGQPHGLEPEVADRAKECDPPVDADWLSDVAVRVQLVCGQDVPLGAGRRQDDHGDVLQVLVRL